MSWPKVIHRTVIKVKTMAVADRKEREKAQRKNVILDTAEKLFFSRGFDSVSMEELAKEIELGKGTLYLYFKSKDALLFAIILRRMNELHEIFQECTDLKLSGREKAKLMGKRYFEFVNENKEYYQMVCTNGPKLFRKLGNEDIHTFMEHMKADLLLHSSVYRAGAEDGTISNDIDPTELAFFVALMTNSIVCLEPGWKIMLEAEGISYQQFVKDFFLFIGNAIGKRPEAYEADLGDSATDKL